METRRYNNRNIFIMTIIVVLIMLGVMSSGVFSAVAFVATSIYFLFIKTENIIYNMFFLLPFATVFKISPNSTSFVTLLLGVALVVLAYRKKGRIKISPFLYIGICFAFVITLVDLFYGNIYVTAIFRNVLGILLVHFLITECSKENIEKLIYSFGTGVFLSSFIAMCADYVPNFYDYVRKVGYNASTGIRFSGMNGDPNYYTISLILVLFGALLLNKKNKLFFWLSFGLTFFFGAQTLSKSFLIIFMVSLIFIFADLMKSENTKITVLFFTVVIIVGFVMFRSGYFTSVDFIIRRITSADSVSELTTGRSDIWVSYLRYIFNSNAFTILFGGGLSAPLLDGKGSHNLFIELLYYFGIIGSALFSLMFTSGYRSVTKKSKTITIGKVGVVMLLALYFNLQMVSSNELYFHIAYILLICKYSNEIMYQKGSEIYYAG